MEQIKTISLKEYNDLKYKELKLDCLEECGVDNWCGYCDALDLVKKYQNNEVE